MVVGGERARVPEKRRPEGFGEGEGFLREDLVNSQNGLSPSRSAILFDVFTAFICFHFLLNHKSSDDVIASIPITYKSH